MRDAGARQVCDLENKMADLKNQLDSERARAEEQVLVTHLVYPQTKYDLWIKIAYTYSSTNK